MKQLNENYVGKTLSEATMRSEDLIPSFLNFLESVAKECQIEDEVNKLQEDVDKLETVVDGYGVYYTNKSQEQSSWILNEDIFDLLDQIAPEFCYFGSHGGDGACYGFWTSDEALSEWIALQVDDFLFDGSVMDFDKVRDTCERVLETLNIHDR